MEIAQRGSDDSRAKKKVTGVQEPHECPIRHSPQPSIHSVENTLIGARKEIGKSLASQRHSHLVRAILGPAVYNKVPQAHSFLALHTGSGSGEAPHVVFHDGDHPNGIAH
jgi:hypothetical protein